MLTASEVSYFSPHFPARNVFAHWRLSGFTDADGLRVAVLNEIQSDWIHDLRWQRLSKPISKRWIAGRNEKIAAIESAKVTRAIPECPLAASWLQVAVDALIADCLEWGADILAWTPGRIQHELNPLLPLPTAQRLYDIRFPKYLEHKLGRKVPEFHVDYPTHSRDVLLERQTNGRFALWTPDQKSPVGQPLPDFDTALRAYRQHARSITEALPAVELLDFG